MPLLRRRTGRGRGLGSGDAAGSHKLDNLIGIVDVNNMQADGPSKGVLDLNLWGQSSKRSAGLSERDDGNDIDALVRAFDAADTGRRPARGS